MISWRLTRSAFLFYTYLLHVEVFVCRIYFLVFTLKILKFNHVLNCALIFEHLYGGCVRFLYAHEKMKNAQRGVLFFVFFLGLEQHPP